MNNLRATEIKKHKLLFRVTMVSIVAYMLWRTFFTLSTEYGALALVFGLLLLVAEGMSAIEAIVNYSMLNKYTPLEVPIIPEEWYPEVDIFIATHNEPVDLLFNTVNACTFLEYPDTKKVHVHLCDDTNRPEMKALAKRLGVTYWGLSENKYAKAGNLNNALRQTNAPIAVTFDADMIPRREFLMRSVPIFYLPYLKQDKTGKWIQKEEHEIDPNEQVGFVQTPQSFYNPDLFQYNLYSEDRIPSEQDLFFREINVSRSAYNAPIYAGSNTLISRKALEDVDYIAVDTITEDILTGLRIQKHGYRCYATSEVLAQGQAPVTIKGLINQRERWARGCIDALRQEPVISSGKLTIAQKVSYVVCWIYWWSSLRRAIFLIAPILSILFNIHVVQASTWQVLVFWLPYYLLLNRSLRVMSGDVWNQHWSNVADTVLFPYLIGPVLSEQFGFTQKKFTVTEKKVTGIYARATFVFGVPHLLFLIGMILSIASLIGKSIAMGTIHSPIILYWLIIGTKNLLFALFFMWGRDNYRLSPRFYFSEPIVVQFGNRIWHTVTSDVSETGMAFYLDNAEFVPEDEKLYISMFYQEHEIIVSGQVVHVVQNEQRWKYSILFDPMDEETKQYYRQIVYDRPHSLPTQLDPSLSLMDDFNLQLGKRVVHTENSMRKLPRMRLDIPFTSEEGFAGVLVDFNYRFAGVKLEQPVTDGEETKMLPVRLEPIQTLSIYVTPTFTLHLAPMYNEDSSNLYYQVLNFEELSHSTHIAPMISNLIQLSPKEKSELRALAVIDDKALTKPDLL